MALKWISLCNENYRGGQIKGLPASQARDTDTTRQRKILKSYHRVEERNIYYAMCILK